MVFLIYMCHSLQTKYLEVCGVGEQLAEVVEERQASDGGADDATANEEIGLGLIGLDFVGHLHCGLDAPDVALAVLISRPSEAHPLVHAEFKLGVLLAVAGHEVLIHFSLGHAEGGRRSCQAESGGATGQPEPGGHVGQRDYANDDEDLGVHIFLLRCEI